MGRRLQEKVGQSVVIENKPGGNGSVSVAALMSSPPDGTTFIIQDGSIYATNPHIYAKMAYSISDLTPTVAIAQAPLFLAVHQKVPVKTMKEFIDYVKAIRQLNYGSSGVGSTHHLSMEALKAALSADDPHPVQGHERIRFGAARRPRRCCVPAYPSLSGAVGTKNITLLATNGAKRSAMAPDVPAIAEFIPGFAFAPTIGIYARTGTPPMRSCTRSQARSPRSSRSPRSLRQFEEDRHRARWRRPEGICRGTQARGRARRQDRQGRRDEAAVTSGSEG